MGGTRRPDGAALLVAGHGASGGAAHTLGQIGEALLATGEAWQIRRLSAATGERYGADRASLKRSLDELLAEPVRALVLVLAGSIVDVAGELALVTGTDAKTYPEDATLPLAWIRERVAGSPAERAIVALSADGDGTPERWLAALATRRGEHVVVTHAPVAKHPLIEALMTGLCGDAVDARTGTVTMASLSEHLARVPQAALQPSRSEETVAQPPPLGGLWDVRRSQLAQRPKVARPDEPEDLTGSVLPGRFRLDQLMARGTFGAVYRARQLAVERDVAVKVLHGDIDASSEDGRLFVHEIRSVGRIDHTNVVRIYQADITHDGRLFFAMELLDGRDLQQVGAEQPLPQARAVALVRQLLAGLGAAHDAGLVHADVKPANAILATRSDGDERVVLVDFGLARLRAPDRPAESAGGTPAYMAPEQLHEGRVDARSDLFSAALVLVFLLTGWRRQNAQMLTPPLDAITDAELRAVLARALDPDPAKRFPSARELAGALIGAVASTPALDRENQPHTPFHHLASLTEADRGRLHGREADLAVLTEHVLYRRALIYTAPSGTGKTSILRAGLLPRLEALGVDAVYVRARGDLGGTLADAIAAHTVDAGTSFEEAATLRSQPVLPAVGGPRSIAGAIATWHQQRGGKLVVVIDQLEAALADADFVPAVLGFDHWPGGADVTVVLSIREDFLARLVEQTQSLEPNLPIVRLPPLSVEGARAAIVGPLAESRLAIEPALLEALLEDLQRAAAAIGPEMGWGTVRAVFPPHLQLACSVLYEALGPGEATLELAHYKRLGGFDAIVGEHLDRVLDTELADGRDVIARDLFVALVTTAHERAMRSESELVAMVARHDPAHVAEVLEVLRSRGLLVRVRSDTGEPGWELVHDSLVPRVRAWIDRKDLARRRAIELVRYHLRRSRSDAPSLLGRAELRELRSHAGAIDELDAELRKRGGDADAWTPSKLVARSRQVLRRRTLTLSSIIFGALALGSIGFYRSQVEKERALVEESLRDRDLGRFQLALEQFDWDFVNQRAVPVPTTTPLAWELHVPDADDSEAPGRAFESSWVVRDRPVREGNALVERVEAHGGPAFLVIPRPGCGDSVVPLRRLPGYADRTKPRPLLRVRVPTCEVAHADEIAVPAGPFVFGGVGEPPSPLLQAYPSPQRETTIDLPAFRIDRTEVTNAAYRMFSELSPTTGISPPVYPVRTDQMRGLDRARAPVSGVDWYAARAYCRFLGKELPTSQQWVKAMRGGQVLPDGTRNPMPRRNLPWGAPIIPVPAHLDPHTKADVGTRAGDTSPYGVRDLAGNVTEWTATTSDPSMRVARGGNFLETTAETLIDFDATQNPREARAHMYAVGLRCVSGN